MDHNISSEDVKTVRTGFLDSYNDIDNCTYLLKSEDIKKNILSLINLLNISLPDYDDYYHRHRPKTLTKDAINTAAKLFLKLNSCPKISKRENILKFFKQVFKKEVFEPTNSGMILYTLNAMKLFSNDERIIASKILEKVSALFNLTFVQSQNNFKILTEDSASSKYIQIRLNVKVFSSGQFYFQH